VKCHLNGRGQGKKVFSAAAVFVDEFLQVFVLHNNITPFVILLSVKSF
jgi:hypothetical protein